MPLMAASVRAAADDAAFTAGAAGRDRVPAAARCQAVSSSRTVSQANPSPIATPVGAEMVIL
jgi:hypothetical protein